tara:strand:- start:821 stop:1030 length:210 start_codon:yes stop_codon:yes gene_type:complete
MKLYQLPSHYAIYGNTDSAGDIEFYSLFDERTGDHVFDDDQIENIFIAYAMCLKRIAKRRRDKEKRKMH